MGPVAAESYVKSGKLRALALASATRIPVMPDLPTFAESGMPGFEIGFWFGVVATAGTPAEIITKLNKELASTLKMADVRKVLEGQGFEIIGGTPADFSAYVKRDTKKWAGFVRETGFKVK